MAHVGVAAEHLLDVVQRTLRITGQVAALGLERLHRQGLVGLAHLQVQGPGLLEQPRGLGVLRPRHRDPALLAVAEGPLSECLGAAPDPHRVGQHRLRSVQLTLEDQDLGGVGLHQRDVELTAYPAVGLRGPV